MRVEGRVRRARPAPFRSSNVANASELRLQNGPSHSNGGREGFEPYLSKPSCPPFEIDTLKSRGFVYVKPPFWWNTRFSPTRNANLGFWGGKLASRLSETPIQASLGWTTRFSPSRNANLGISGVETSPLAYAKRRGAGRGAQNLPIYKSVRPNSRSTAPSVAAH